MNHIFLYVILRLDTIHTTIFFLVVLSLTALGIITYIYLKNSIKSVHQTIYDEDENKRKEMRQDSLYVLKRFSVCLLVLLSLDILIPTTKQMAVIYCLPKITNGIADNEKMQQLPDKLIGLTDAWLDELQPNSKEKEGE